MRTSAGVETWGSEGVLTRRHVRRRRVVALRRGDAEEYRQSWYSTQGVYGRRS